MNNQKPGQNVNIKISDEMLKGNYANMMMVSHTQEEFVLDFMNVLPPSGVVTSRIITSPGHLKRIIAALNDNLKKYESQFGAVKEASAPVASEVGFRTQS
jgi:hypothetical protein